MSSYLITGCSRGLGLELVRTLVKRPDSSARLILATSRSERPSEQLRDIISTAPDRVRYIRLDTESSNSIEQAVARAEQELGSAGLDVLINNAGVGPIEPDGARGMHTLQSTLATNVVAVHKVTAAFLPLLQRGREKKVVNIGSTVGSIGMKDLFAMIPCPSYKISKTALNMLTVQYSLDLGKEGFIVVAINPGWLKTDMGGENADLMPAQGADATVDMIENLTRKDNGGYKNIYIPDHPSYDGKQLPCHGKADRPRREMASDRNELHGERWCEEARQHGSFGLKRRTSRMVTSAKQVETAVAETSRLYCQAKAVLRLVSNQRLEPKTEILIFAMQGSPEKSERGFGKQPHNDSIMATDFVREGVEDKRAESSSNIIARRQIDLTRAYQIASIVQQNTRPRVDEEQERFRWFSQSTFASLAQVV